MNRIENIPSVSELIDDTFKDGAKPVLDRLTRNITIKSILKLNSDNTEKKDAEEASLQMGAFLKAFEQISGYCHVELYAENEAPDLEAEIGCDGHYPATGIYYADGSYSGISFLGIPGGKEINSFLLAVYNTAGPGQTTAEAVIERAKAIAEEKSMCIFVSLSCQHCENTVTACMRLASLNPNISAQMIDARLYPDLVETYHIERVPVVFLNGEYLSIGEKNIEEMIALIV